MSKSKIFTLYTNRGLLFSDLQEEIKNCGGSIKVLVVKEKQESSGEEMLMYGLFYEAPNGELCDVLQASTQLKTWARVEHLMIALTKLGVESSVHLPMLIEKNLKTHKDFE